jgi:O-antigen/teichoic acid export membrane protein
MKDILTSFASTGAIQLANIGTGILAARLLLPEGRGELAFLLLWPPLVADVGALGVYSAVAYYSARRDFAPQALFASGAAIVALLSAVLMAGFAIAVPFLYADHRPEMQTAGWIFVAFVPVHLMSYCLMTQFQGAQEFTVSNSLRAVLPYAYLAIVVALAALPAGLATPENFAYAFLGGNVAAMLAGFACIVRRGWFSLEPSRAAMRALLRYGTRFHASMLLAIANRRLDYIMIAFFLPPAQLGFYVVATAVQGLPLLATSTMDILVFPKVAAQPDEAGRQAVLARYMRATLILVVGSTVVLIAVAPPFVGLVFGEAFAGAGDAVRILLLAALPFTAKTLMSSYFRAGDRMKVVGKAESFSLVALVAAVAVLVPAFGILGAAVSQVLAATVAAVYLLARARRDHGLDLGRLVRFDAADAALLRELAGRLRGRSGDA